TLRVPCCASILAPERSAASRADRQFDSLESFGGGIMNARRFTIIAAALYLVVVLAGWAVARLAGFAPAGIENAAVAAIADGNTPTSVDRMALVSKVEAQVPQATALGNFAVDNVDGATATEQAAGTSKTAASVEPATTFVVASADP